MIDKWNSVSTLHFLWKGNIMETSGEMKREGEGSWNMKKHQSHTRIRIL